MAAAAPQPRLTAAHPRSSRWKDITIVLLLVTLLAVTPALGSAPPNTGTTTFGAGGISGADANFTTLTAGTITGNLVGNSATVTNGLYSTGSYADPAWITSLGYAKLTGAPTPVNQANLVYTNGSYADPAWLTSLSYSKLSGTPGGVNQANLVYTNGSYANPSWLTSLDAGKLFGSLTLTGQATADSIWSNTQTTNGTSNATRRVTTGDNTADSYWGNTETINGTLTASAVKFTNWTGTSMSHIGNTSGGALSTTERHWQLNSTSGTAGANSNYALSKLNDTMSLISATGTANEAWIPIATGTPSVNLILPYGVVIGDSIAEGQTTNHGHLYSSYGPNYLEGQAPNQPGTFAYELGGITGYHWMNQGIGGQNATQIWNRWNRDALGVTDSNVGDGRPSSTLPNGKPAAILVVVGTNDNTTGTPISILEDRYTDMAKSSRDNGIPIAFMGICPRAAIYQSFVVTVNAWMQQTLPQYGAYYVDCFNLMNTGSNTFNTLYTSDGTHPNLAGYKVLSRLVSETFAPAAINLRGLIFESPMDPGAPLTTYNRPTIVNATVSNQTSTLYPDSTSHAFVPFRTSGYDYNLTLTINSTSGSGYTGWAKVRAILSPGYTMLQSTADGTFSVQDATNVVSRYGINATQFSVSDPANLGAFQVLGWLNDQARIRVGGTGAGSASGFQVQGPSDVMLWGVDGSGIVKLAGQASLAGLPTCDSTHRFQEAWVTGGAGVADKKYACVKTPADAYAWQAIFTAT